MPTANGLGINCETYRQPRASAKTIVSASTLPVSASPAPTFKVPKGFFATFLYSTLFFVIPVLNEYVTYDYDTTFVRVGVIAAASLAALALVFANDCVAWFNMVLFFHLGVEVTVLDKVMEYAQDDARDQSSEVLAWIAFGILIFHLVPFLILDYEKTLIVCGFAGIIANSATLVFVDPTKLLIASSSSSALLLSVLLIACIECVQTSALSQLKNAMRAGFVKCLPYES
jgi:hypothetical protein